MKNVQLERIINNDIIACESALFSEVNRIAYEIDTSLSELLYENFENLHKDNSLKIEELENEIVKLEMKAESIKNELDEKEELESEIENIEMQIEDLESIVEELELEQEDIQEILEVWKVSQWLYEELRLQGEPVLDSSFGYYWGRTCSGQSISMDSVIQNIAQD